MAVKEKIRETLLYLKKISENYNHNGPNTYRYYDESKPPETSWLSDLINKIELDPILKGKIDSLKFYLEEIGAYRLIDEVDKVKFIQGRGLDKVKYIVNSIVYEELEYYLSTGELRYTKSLKINTGNNRPTGNLISEDRIFELKDYIANNDLSRVIDELLAYLKKKPKEYDSVIQISFRYKTLKDSINKGVLSDDEMTIRLNNISSSLLDIINKLNK